jgi:hypothetical protein
MDNKNEIEWNDRFEGFKFISETQQALREQRRKPENQEFFFTVAFYPLVGASKFTGK